MHKTKSIKTTHTHICALTDLLIKTDSVLAHLINPQRQLPGENRPHYARKKKQSPHISTAICFSIYLSQPGEEE